MHICQAPKKTVGSFVQGTEKYPKPNLREWYFGDGKEEGEGGI